MKKSPASPTRVHATLTRLTCWLFRMKHAGRFCEFLRFSPDCWSIRIGAAFEIVSFDPTSLEAAFQEAKRIATRTPATPP